MRTASRSSPMLRFVQTHGPSMGAFAVMLLIFAGFAGAFGPGTDVSRTAISAFPATPAPLPDGAEDRDQDTYADDVDLWTGDLLVGLDVSRLRVPDEEHAEPYLLVGTEDDHWRFGAGGDLEWRRVYDHDPFGHPPGSPEWIEGAMRTGAWWQSIAMEGERHAVAPSGDVRTSEGGMVWPQEFMVNVRDDRPLVRVDVELWDAATDPHALRGSWRLEVDVNLGFWRSAEDAPWHESGAVTVLGGLGPGRTGLEVAVRLLDDVDPVTRQEIAERWAPVLHFADDERFFPTRGDALEQFHGFAHREPDHRTWLRSFNNGRDAYRLLLADFNGDGLVDHRDAAVLTDVLRAGGVAQDTVYAHVGLTTAGHVVVQYWFVYFYNFIPDDAGRDVGYLAHAGDREFMQLVFKDPEAARNGTPLHTVYSQHYGGAKVPYDAQEPPFHVDPDRPSVFVAYGSHASYPAAGDDRALRHSLSSFGDVFHGDGEVWTPGNYTIELLGPQTWHAGYLYGPLTRHSRELGTAARPLLQYEFSYPFMDPLHWGSSLMRVEADQLEALYGGGP